MASAINEPLLYSFYAEYFNAKLQRGLAQLGEGYKIQTTRGKPIWRQWQTGKPREKKERFSSNFFITDEVDNCLKKNCLLKKKVMSFKKKNFELKKKLRNVQKRLMKTAATFDASEETFTVSV
ncbi:hypothetical protein DAPPUDRAFT_329104 [Daphnia pulex]|uniref:Uncharacterized protein n=1 Tax=Daphnia pulex TaxID=6669 RepID=E9HFP3_DAPPU|nr:hypothetical protein DAPPUDRAFT_329104 [Daphnia pulex]|eukprot:EFX69467.1 hypothetical protein DAPPUDRAFT_329104 [Daphnia pulex]